MPFWVIERVFFEVVGPAQFFIALTLSALRFRKEAASPSNADARQQKTTRCVGGFLLAMGHEKDGFAF